MDHIPNTVEPASGADQADSPLNIVLDTNVWLDWLVFNDASTQPLESRAKKGRTTQAGMSGSLSIWAGAHGRGELAEVIGRAHFKLSAEQQAACLARFDLLTTGSDKTCPPVSLRCSDPDDQPFLELAVAHDARFLLSRDRALLKLGRQAQRIYNLRILTPEQFNLAQADPTATAAP